MTKKEFKKYSVALDIGTTSVGYAVVNDDYNIMKFKNKNMWGVRLFEAGDTAANRRIARTTRRRIQRRKERIALLKSCVGEIVVEKDPDFFMHLEKGFMTTEDKGYAFNLFNDPSFNDVQFYDKFKTMYHLRKHLCTSTEKADPRFIYLALHHIFKYRGNFLYEGQSFNVSQNEQTCEMLSSVIYEVFKSFDYIKENSDQLSQQMLSVLVDKTLKKAIKKETIVKMFADIEKEIKPQMTEIVNLLLGYESNLSKLFPEREIQKDDKDYKTNFSTTKYEDDSDFIENTLQEDFEYLSLLHNVYSFVVLQDILSGHEMLFDAMIEKFDTHRNDLRLLKLCIRKTGDIDLYQKVFRSKQEKGNYYFYVNEPRITSKDDFYTFIKKILNNHEKLQNSEECASILNKIEMDNFLPKQNSKDNGVIPYQLHKAELLKIIEKQGKFYPVLVKEKDKLESLLEFRIPYYVGPLNNASAFSWVTRNKNIKITPWNFEKEVDLLESAESFIRKMTNCCSYLLTEPVVPKKSLLYSKYEVLNELNKIRVNGKLIDTDIKKMIVNEVFMKKNKIKKKDIEDFYIRKQLCDKDATLDIKGFQKEDEFASSLESWIKFKSIYQDSFDTSLEEIETLIEWISVYEDKKILKKRIEKEFPEIAKDHNKLKQITKLRYKGWGRLSKKLLNDLRVKDKLGDFVSIMDCLENTQMNFMQIINDKDIDFKHAIEAFNQSDEELSAIKYEQISRLQGSPAIKKGIWQTVQIVDEIVEIMNCDPQHIFIEFAREDNEKKRTQSRIKKLQEIYADQIKNKYTDLDFVAAYKELKKCDKGEKLDNDRLALYFIQQGKCMYSGKPLDISSLHLYQVDHILPQSYIKDDSIENKALVISSENQSKGDNLLLSKDIINRQYHWWSYLLKNKLIGEKKFRNLTRTFISEKEEIGFINRQLVETRQITKHVANLFKNVYKDTNVVSIKASLSSEFRKKFELYKVREINDFHHAQDAYIASVIGTFVMRKYDSLRKDFIFTEYNQVSDFKKDLGRMQSTKSKYGFILNSMSDKLSENHLTGEVVWEGSRTIEKIRKVFEYKDCFITKKTEERKGQLFNLTINKNTDLEVIIKKNPHKVIPINKQRSDISKYGGFTSLEKAYGIAVEYKLKNKVKREVLDVPRILANAPEEDLMEYLKNETGSNKIKIVKSKILYNQLFEIDGGLYTMASASEWNNARQLILSSQSVKTLYLLFNSKTNKPSDEQIVNVYDEYLEKVEKFYPLLKGVYEKLSKQRDNFITSKDKEKILKELLKATKANPSYGSLTDEGFKISSSIGRFTMKKINLSKISIVSQSITGMFVKKYKL